MNTHNTTIFLKNQLFSDIHLINCKIERLKNTKIRNYLLTTIKYKLII